MVSDFPFGFGPGNPDQPDKGPESGADPFGALFGGAGSADIGAALQRFGQLLSSSSGPVHWDLARDTARQLVAADGDPSVTSLQRASVAEAVELAEVWLADATALPGIAPTPAAWSRAEWIEQTLPRWKALIEPLAERMSAATSEALPGQIPPEMQAMAGPLLGMMGQMSGVMYGGQVGQGLGALAHEVLTSSDIGLPLGPARVAALVPRNVEEFGAGLGVPEDQVRIYLALRECAHLRLFAHAPWLSTRLEAAISDYARGISIDLSAIEQSLGGVDPTRPEALTELLSSGVFEPPTTPEQEAARDRLEHLIALVEGWVDDVTWSAADGRLPAAAALRETIRRRRATGGPAEHTFETLVGLVVRPRRLREASAFWHSLVEAESNAARDHLWDHPDLLPGPESLDDPAGFTTGSTGGDWDISTINDTEAPPEASGPEASGPSA